MQRCYDERPKHPVPVFHEHGDRAILEQQDLVAEVGRKPRPQQMSQHAQIATESATPIDKVCIEVTGVKGQSFDKKDFIKVHQGIIKQRVCFSL